MCEPVIISCAVTGNKWMREDSPYIPYSPEEIVAESISAIDAGATILHVHARTQDGKLAQRPEDFRPILEGIWEKRPGVLVEMSVGNMEGKVKERLEPLLKLKPNMASFNLKGTKEETELMFEIFNKYGVKPVFELFNEDMLKSVMEYTKRGLVEEPLYFNFVFDLVDVGKQTIEYADYLIDMVKKLPIGSQWTVTRGGFRALEIAAVAASINGGIRTGLEDSIYLEEGKYAKNNEELVIRVKKMVESVGKRAATLEETKQMLGL